MIFLQLVINSFVLGSVYALVALGFALIYNTTRIFHIAYSALFIIPPFLSILLFTQFKFPLLLSCLVSIFLTCIISVGIEYWIYQPFYKGSNGTNAALISSIGVMIIITGLVSIIFGSETYHFNYNISPTFTFGPLIITYIQWWQFLICNITVILFLSSMKLFRLGVKIRALRDSHVLFKAVGMNTNKTRLWVFCLSGLFISISANLVAYDIGIDPYIGMSFLLNAIVALIVGGIGSFVGPVIGGFIISFLQSFTVYLFSDKIQEPITFLILIFFLLYRPQGLLGEKKRIV